MVWTIFVTELDKCQNYRSYVGMGNRDSRLNHSAWNIIETANNFCHQFIINKI